MIQIDPTYALSAQAGKQITSDGAGAIAVGGGKIIANDGATIIANDGATLVALGAGNIIASDGATIIASDGATIIENDGATIIANDGATFKTLGFNVLADAPTASSTPLPAAGMVLYLVDLATNAAVPLGWDANRKNVYTVYSNARGGFQFYLPANEATSQLRVMARAAGSSDPHLAYNLVTPAASTTATSIDQTTDLLSTLERRCILTRLEASAGQSRGGRCRHRRAVVDRPGDRSDGHAVRGIEERLEAGLCGAKNGRLFAELSARGPHLRDGRAAGVVPRATSSATKAVDVLNDECAEMLAGAKRVFAVPGQADYFATRPYMGVANARRAKALLPCYDLKTPTDVGEFWVGEYLGADDSDQRNKSVACHRPGVLQLAGPGPAGRRRQRAGRGVAECRVGRRQPGRSHQATQQGLDGRRQPRGPTARGRLPARPDLHAAARHGRDHRRGALQPGLRRARPHGAIQPPVRPGARQSGQAVGRGRRSGPPEPTSALSGAST